MERGNDMKEQISARQTVRLFCSSWFEQRDVAKITGAI